MRYLIIGLGIYGSNLARDLTDKGHEIIGADNRKTNVDAIKDYISTVYLLDATEEASLSLLPLNNVDLVIVAIGENFGASVKVVALLKKLKVKHIYARAIDTLHESILNSFNLDRILTPEQRAAQDLSDEMSIGSKVQSLSVDDENFVMKFTVPKQFVGQKYIDLNLENAFRLKIVALTRETPSTNLLGIRHAKPRVISITQDTVVEVGDALTCFGPRKGYTEFDRQIDRI